jgi:D-alanine-D-alanine ligase
MEKKSKIRLALVRGGRSAERDVSLAGAREVQKALDAGKYDVTVYDPAHDIARLAAHADSIDVAFILLHGRFGEDGTIQGLFDMLDIPYQGSGVLGSALAMDKHLSKVVYRSAGIPTPDWVTLGSMEEFDAGGIVDELGGLPLMVKPCSQGSSVGMAVVSSETALEPAVCEAFRWDSRVMVEAFAAGREITAGVLGNSNLEALPLVEIIPGDKYEFFDKEAKYKPGATKEICPAEIPEDITRLAQETGIAAHRALCLKGYSRTDMMLGDDGTLMVLETNTIPGMTPTSLFPQAAAAAGLSFSALIDRLIELAMESSDGGASS